jgi:hypothetical protein
LQVARDRHSVSREVVRLREHVLEHGGVGDAGRGDGRLHRERELY